MGAILFDFLQETPIYEQVHPLLNKVFDALYANPSVGADFICFLCDAMKKAEPLIAVVALNPDNAMMKPLLEQHLTKLKADARTHLADLDVDIPEDSSFVDSFKAWFWNEKDPLKQLACRNTIQTVQAQATSYRQGQRASTDSAELLAALAAIH